MIGLRYAATLVIVVALAGGIWTRYVSALPGQSQQPAPAEAAFAHAGLALTGSFQEPLGGLTGFEVSFPKCQDTIAVLPVPARNTTIAPAEYRYGGKNYNVSYLYNGTVYSQSWISYKLSLLNVYYRVRALVSLSKPEEFKYYYKIWASFGCTSLTSADVSALERALGAIAK